EVDKRQVVVRAGAGRPSLAAARAEVVFFPAPAAAVFFAAAAGVGFTPVAAVADPGAVFRPAAAGVAAVI
ncbi:hypothetical protein, partial [Verrucosispora sp. SN26_14.1]|uniref:hypothetical protein n=1 Tax=Verrucosispora sp. SN26_14.1 TaxID=2527879 RepID=UPI001F481B8A